MAQEARLLRQDINEAVGQGAAMAQTLHVLAEVTSSLASHHDIEGLLGRFLKTMVELSGAEAAAVRVLTTDGSSLRLLASVGLPPQAMEAERMVALDCGVCGSALQRDLVAHTCDARGCSVFDSLPALRGEGAVIAIPMQHNGRILGVYNLFMREGEALAPDVAVLFRSVSEQLGMALDNSRLLRENLRMSIMNERQMIANEVHDSLAQTMAYMKMRLDALQEAQQQDDIELSRKYAADIQVALDQAYLSLRDLLAQFRNRMDPLGLVHAMQDIVDGFYDRSGIELEFENRLVDLDLTVEQEVQIFHILQEALSNVVRHSGARRAKLILDSGSGYYTFTVEDDGRGVFVLGAHPDLRHHFGISIMQERAERLNGRVEISNRPAGGARLRLLVPMPAPAG